MIASRSLLLLVALLVLVPVAAAVGCSRPANKSEAVNVPPVASSSSSSGATSTPSSASSVAAIASGAPSASSSAAPTPFAATPSYPVGRECSKLAAIAKEKRTLPPVADWKVVGSAHHRLTAKVPDKVFVQTSDTPDGLRLVSAVKAHELGPDGKDRPFSIRVRRIGGKTIDEILADRKSKASPLNGIFTDGAFPKGTTASFVPSVDEPLGSGAAIKTTILNKPAFVWINGVEGYNTDTALIELGHNDTLLVIADWNSSIMMGQPECWQRAVIGGVVDNLLIEGVRGSIPAGGKNVTKTIAGDLEIVERKPMYAYEMRLLGKTLAKTDLEDPNDKRANGPQPSIVRSFGDLGAFDEVLLVRWDGPGNACFSYGYSFLQLKKDGTATLSEDIPYCGGPDPVVTLHGTQVLVTFPKHKPNRGEGEIASETWIYEAGAITKMKK